MSRARVTVTLPESVLEAADERARELERSRSWLVTEALRRYLERPSDSGGEPTIRETPAAGYAGTIRRGLGAYRAERLRSDLALTLEQRVEEAERAARVAELRAPRWRRERLLLFDGYEDYLDWERGEGLEG